jgi:hypothetical protein
MGARKPPPTNGFKKGQKKVGGRQLGRSNRLTQDMKEALLGAATAVGFIHEDDVLDENGKPTGATKMSWNGDGGLQGYLEWAAVYRASHFIPQLGRIMPLQVNVKAEAPKRVVYPSLEDTRAALRAKGIDPDVIQRAMMVAYTLISIIN